MCTIKGVRLAQVGEQINIQTGKWVNSRVYIERVLDRTTNIYVQKLVALWRC